MPQSHHVCDDAMRAMILGRSPGGLHSETLDLPPPSSGEVRGRVLACGVCRTDLHLVDGELPDPTLPVVPGHEVVAVAEEVGQGVGHVRPGERFGVPWLGWTCGECRYCSEGRENLCENAQFTGFPPPRRLRGRNPGRCALLRIDPRRLFRRTCRSVAVRRPDRATAAGSWPARRKDSAFMASAPRPTSSPRWRWRKNQDVYAFVRPGDRQGEAFARELGAVWAGPSDRAPPRKLDAALIFAPVGGPDSLRRCRRCARAEPSCAGESI